MVLQGGGGTRLGHRPGARGGGERAGAGRVQLVTRDDSRVVDPPPLPPSERDGPTHFLSCASAGRAVTGFCAADVGCDVQEVIAAGQPASAPGRRAWLSCQPWSPATYSRDALYYITPNVLQPS